MTIKIDRINDAYSQLRISGITVQPSPGDVRIALSRLENMMAEFFSRGICVNYNFEPNPDPSSLTNVVQAYWHMISTNLAIRLIPDFNKQAPPMLLAQASSSLSNASGRVAMDNARQVQYPRRMARGSGNTLRFNRWQRFQRPTKLPPNQCPTNKLIVDDVNDYQESFRAYLDDTETIASFTISVDPGLTLISSTNNDPIIDYRIRADDDSTQGVWQQVKIIITTSTGRVATRIINFEVVTNDTVGIM